jgi:hypothetical protein
MQFELEALTRELGLIHELAEAFLEPESARALEEARWRLHSLPHEQPKSSWEISTPLRTTLSPGEYRPSGMGEHTVRAEITTLWEITRTNQQTVTVRDNVSTSISIATVDEVIGRWTMDIAAVSSAPGCGLHAQIKESESWFPKDLDVPRLPVFIPTLGSVLEFVLGELFQQKWTAHVSAHRNAASWRALQARLWTRWLDWQLETVRRATVSPWLDVKARLCEQLEGY